MTSLRYRQGGMTALRSERMIPRAWYSWKAETAFCPPLPATRGQCYPGMHSGYLSARPREIALSVEDELWSWIHQPFRPLYVMRSLMPLC